MKSFTHSIAALAGLICLTSGCAGESIEAGADDAPALSPLDVITGHSGSNGLPPIYYHPRRYALDSLFQLPLTVNGALNPDSRFTNFIATPEGNMVFAHAVGCALAAGKSAGPFVGEGFMDYTGGWLTGPLGLQARSDLHTCLTARLNPFGIEVPIWIGGPDTTKDTAPTKYPYFEALWSVAVSSGTVGVPPVTVFSIWPSDTITRHTS